jgi:hypothetical protein
MINTGQIYREWEQGPVTIRALRSLTRADADVVVEAVQALGSGWSVEQVDDYEGYLSLLISALDESAAKPDLLISGKLGQIELAELRGDNLHTFGCFKTIDQAVAKLRTLLT